MAEGVRKGTGRERMIYFVTLMVSISVTTAFMLMFLIVLARKEKYSFTWIYGLIKTGLILLTVPVVVMVFLFVFGVLMSEFRAVDDMTNITAIYNGRYVVLRRFYFFRPYIWILFGIWLAGIFVSLGKTGKDIITFRKNVLVHNRRISHETVLMKNGKKRKHIFFKALSVAVRTLYWFNPFTYYFVDFFSDYCEMDCDREVLKDAEVKQRIAYAENICKVSVVCCL